MKNGFQFQNAAGDTVTASFANVVKMTMEKMGEASVLAITWFHPFIGPTAITDTKEMEMVLAEYQEWLDS